MPKLPNRIDRLPPFLMSSVPKSGTHLLQQILLGMPNITFDQPSLHNKFIKHSEPTNYQDHFSRLSKLKPNEFGRGHLTYSMEYARFLRRIQMKHLFIHRDLRDILISWVHYIINKYPSHPLYADLKNPLMSQKQRYLLLINGKSTRWLNFADYNKPYYGWLNDPDTLSITYEELMGSHESRRISLLRIATFLWKDHISPISINKMVKSMEANIDPKKSPTFRSGKIGNWKKEFDEEVKAAFKKTAGNLLIQLGYEHNNNW
jgi:hypothetical protein